MIVKPQHPNAYADGLIHLPYLDDWQPNRHNLLDLCKTLSVTFSSIPPLFQRPPNTYIYPTSNPVNYSSNYPTNYQSNNPTNYSSNYQTNNPTNYSTNYSSTSYKQIITSGSTSGVNKQDLINELTNKIQNKLQSYYYSLRTQIDKEFNVEVELTTATATMNDDIKQLIDYKEKLEISLLDIKTKFNEIDNWIDSQVDNKIDSKIDEQIDKYIKPFDDLTNQLNYLTSRIQVLDEAIYLLTRVASSDRQVDINSYIKETRKLSRELFLNQMLVNKITLLVSK
mmetsp:Transcript_19911/g.18078  ORF Transcript_19911/g.18078 Transcript_19911/m.18078 type:complete len:282 (+) Transcript_19911:470-1315(+)